MPSGERIGCGRSRARWSCIRTFRSPTSKRRWSTSRAERSNARNRCLREGTIVQDRQANLKQRYPAKGLHWLLGLVRLARGDVREARAEFDREIALGPTQLYAAEFAMNAYDGAGFAALEERRSRRGRAGCSSRRSSCFQNTPARSSDSASRCRKAAMQAAPTQLSAMPRRAIDSLRRGGRISEATLAEAFMQAVQGKPDDAIGVLKRLVDRPEMPFAGWTIPIEPLFAPSATTH